MQFFLGVLSGIWSKQRIYYCHAVFLFWVAGSVFIRPCSSALLSCIDVHVFYCFIEQTDEDDADEVDVI